MIPAIGVPATAGVFSVAELGNDGLFVTAANVNAAFCQVEPREAVGAVPSYFRDTTTVAAGTAAGRVVVVFTVSHD